MKEKTIKICNVVIELSFYLLFFFIPLILTPVNYELFEYNKMMLTYGLTIIIAGAWLIKIAARRELKIQRTPLDFFLLLFFLSQIISTIFSLDRHTSIFGFYSRFHGGLLSTVSYVLLYYALVSNLNSKKKVFNFLYLSLFSGFLVASYGILEHFGIDAKYWVQDVKNRVFSTLGQPNWLAAYLNILLFITIGLIFTFKNRLKIFACYILLTTYYICLLYTKSRSGFIAFIVSLVFFTLISSILAFFQKNLRRSFRFLATCYLLLATITFFVQPPFFHLDKIGYSRLKSLIISQLRKPSSAPSPTVPTSTAVPITPAGPALEVGGSESGVIRKIVWQGALDIALSYPFFGSGVETFAYAYYKFRPAAHNLVSEWDFLYNKAHNEFLNYAATTGFIGLGTYLFVILAFCLWVLKIAMVNFKMQNANSKMTNKNPKFLILNCNFEFLILIFALLTAYITILITNFFGFSVVMVAIYFWLIPAFSFILSDSLNPEKSLTLKFYQPLNDTVQKGTEKIKKRHGTYLAGKQAIKSSLSNFQTAFIFSVLFVICYLLFVIYRYWLADTKYALGLNYDKANNFTVAYPLLKKAISLNSREPIYYDELSFASANIAVLAFTQKQNQLATQLINEALTSSQKAIKISPNNVNFYKTRTKMFYLLSAINEKYNYEALQALLQAKELAPTDAKIYYNLAILYGRVNQKQQAIDTLKETVNLKENYRDARYALGLYLAENGQINDAVAQMEIILQKIDPNDGQAKAKIKEWKGL